MRIGLINTEVDGGGAARAMQRTIAALNAAGHETILVTLASSGRTEAPVVRIEDRTSGPAARRAGVAHYFYNGRYVDRNRTDLSNTLFWVPTVGLSAAEVVGRLELDVINVHWSSYFLSLKSMNELMSLPMPVVLTLHDMAHFTGGCHYAAGCRGFEDQCHPCPQLRLDPLSVPRDVRRSRARVYQSGRPWAIAPSRWMANQAERSGLFVEGRVRHIANVLDAGRFSPAARAAVRQSFGIAPDTRVVLFGAVDNRERRKGFDLLVSTLSEVVAQAKAPVAALSFGAHPPALKVPGLQVIETGFIEDDDQLADVYRAADVTMIPSREDNLPNIMLESLACGTPVAGFAVGGVGETLEHGVTGALAEPGDPAALAAAILLVLRAGADGDAMRNAARLAGERFGDAQAHADAYVEVFQAARAAAGFAIPAGSPRWPGPKSQPSPQFRPGLLEYFGGLPAESLIRLRAMMR